MRILYVGTLPPHRGGSAVCSWSYLSRLAAKGHRIRIITPTVAGESVDAENVDSWPGIEIERFQMPYMATDIFSTFDQAYRDRQIHQVVTRLGRALATDSYDLIWVCREDFIPGVADVARRWDTPWVVFLHGIMKAIANDTFADPEFGSLVIDGCREADRAIPVASHLAADLERKGLVNVSAHPNGVDVGHFAPRPDDGWLRRRLGIPGNARIVLHVSNFKPVKCIADIVGSAAETMAADPNIFYVLVGEGGERAGMEAQAAGLGLSDRFRFPGWVSHQALPDYYRMADLFVLASSTEVAPLALLEAMACGAAVVASDIPASREIIDDGIDGVLYRQGDVGALARTLMDLLEDSERRRRIGAAVRRKMQDRRDLAVITAGLEAKLLQLIRARAGPEPALSASS
ncbi:MAG: glycosyltransferase family 4 protein [Alphaproteobacteria bacterium]|nr:glycosyltransferase family 4 protein [Alphaproteobacteria bacterium]